AETDHLGIFQIQKGIEVVDQSILPREYALHQNYPNPFNPSSHIRFDLPRDANVTIQIYNILGELVSEIAKDCHYSAGYHSVIWDGTNSFGKTVSSSIYYYSIKAGHFTATKKMILVR
ncbi:MAG: T9SS type A sorting domain-containing protein, partial [Candidatus Marinimicrobia bacterium]|nr:T9SS type A sorting domain-containing protein [Candidatus Neomarinimicrobiota bacterium]